NLMNERVEVRCAGLDSLAGEKRQFDFAVANPRVLPFPSALAAPAETAPTDDGMTALRLALDATSDALAPGGTAQLVASGAGNHARPRLCDELTERAARTRTRIVMSVSSRLGIRPGDRLFEIMASRCATI